MKVTTGGDEIDAMDCGDAVKSELSDIDVMLWHKLFDAGTDTFKPSFVIVFEAYAESSAPFVLSSSLITGVSVWIVASWTEIEIFYIEKFSSKFK